MRRACLINYGVCEGETVGDGDIIGVGVGSDGLDGVAVGEGVGVGSDGFVGVGCTVGVGFSVSIGVGGIPVGLTVGEIRGERIAEGLTEGVIVGDSFTRELLFGEIAATIIPDNKNIPAVIIKNTLLYIKILLIFRNINRT